MASIRRTLSPYHDRTHQNGGGSPFSVNAPSHKLSQNGKCSSSSSSPLSAVRRFLAGLFLQKYSSRRGHLQTWRRTFYLCLLLFLLGFLLGMAPVRDVEDDVHSHRHDFSYIREDAKDFVTVAKPEEEDFVVDKVELLDKRRSNLEEEEENNRFDFIPRKQLIVVTPTYNRALQAFYLTRLGQLLKLVPPPLIWIVVEMNSASTETADVLRGAGVVYRHLVCKRNSTNVKDRGVHQRNTALQHIKHHRLDGIVYFADDDNIYSLELFNNMREISRFGTWPVAMLAQSKNKAVLEGPVCNGSKVIGWHTNEKSKQLRRFHVDMSGFAFNSTILWDPKRWKRPTLDPIRQLDTVKEGFQETTFIEQLVEDESQMEGTPPGCSRIMNWHLHLEAHEIVYPSGWLLKKNLDVILPTI